MYTIRYNEDTDTYFMNGFSENFIGCHLQQIAKENEIDPNEIISESYGLHLLRGNGIEIELLDHDGSELTW